jgi:hypothetical protein
MLIDADAARGPAASSAMRVDDVRSGTGLDAGGALVKRKTGHAVVDACFQHLADLESIL